MDPSVTAQRSTGLENNIDMTQFQGDISKLNSSVLKSIDGNSLQLIIQRNSNESAYIDHALPEYISSNFHANGLIVDLVPHHPHDQSIESVSHIYGNSESIEQSHSPIQISNDRRCYIASNEATLHHSIHVPQNQIQHLDSRSHFQTIDDGTRRVIISEANRSYISATEAPVIVCNKDASAIEDIDYSTHFSSAFSQIDQNVHLHGMKADDIAADEELLNGKMQSNAIPPLPPLTPIPKIQSARLTPPIDQQNAVQMKVSSVPQNFSAPVPKNRFIPNRNVCLITTEDEEINYIHSNMKYMRQPSREVSIGPKKNLPHKKRITKKLKNISPTMEDQMHIQLSDLSYHLPSSNGNDTNLVSAHEVQQFLSSSTSAQQNVSLNLTMNSQQPIQLTTSRIERLSNVKETKTFSDTNHHHNFSSQSLTRNSMQLAGMLPVLIPFTCQLCGAQIEEQFEFYMHLKMHYEPDKMTTTHDLKVENSRNVLRNHHQHSEPVIDSNLILNPYHLPRNDDNERKISNGSCIQTTTVPSQVVLDGNFAGIQNNEHDFNCMNGIVVETEDISDDDSMMINDYSDTGLNAIKAEQNEFSDTEDMLENGVLDKVQRVVDSYIENGGTSDVKNLIEMNEPQSQCQWATGATPSDAIMVVDKGSCSSKVIRNTNEGIERTSEAETAELAIMYELNVNDKDFENSTESILRHQKMTDRSERITLDSAMVDLSAIQQAPTKLPNKKTDCIKNEKIKASNSTPKSVVDKVNIHDEFIVEEQISESEIDSIDKPDALKRKRKIYRCKRCDKLCNSKNALSYHLLSHTGERPYKCDECPNAAFFSSSALKVHKRLHSGDKPYQCNQCVDTFFRQWGDLKYHIQSKHSEKSEVCEYCGKSFARRYSLVLHRRIHTGEKNYKCDFCDAVFRAASYLQVHRKIHTGEKDYVCPESGCARAFRVRSDLKRHSKIHERNKIEKDVLKVNTNSSGATNEKNKLFASDENNSIQSRSTMDTLDQLVSVIESTDDAFVVNECTDNNAPTHRNFPQFELDQGFSKMKFKRDPANVSPVIVNYNNNNNNGNNK